MPWGIALVLGTLLGCAGCGIYGAVYDNTPLLIEGLGTWLKGKVRR